MKKFASLLIILALVLSAFGASAFADTTYVGNTVYAEAGYEGDCYIVVTNWFYYVSGTYEVVSDDEGTLEVVLTGTEVTYVMNGSVTTSEEDPELLEDYAELTVECDNDTFSVKEA